MNLSALNLNLLVALESLLEEQSVSRAAERVSLSQPAMSHALKSLRTVLRDPLLVRTGARMQLTARGEALRYPVKDALARVRDLLVSGEFDPATSTRNFSVFIADNASDLLLPPLLKRLAVQAPGISIRVQAVAGGLLDPLELTRFVDLAVACVPSLFTGFSKQYLYTDRDACAVRRGHPMRSHIARVETFLEMKHVAVVGREFSEDPVDTWLRAEGHERAVALSVPHYLQALRLVAQSDLIAVIPQRLIQACATGLDLDVVEVPLDVGTFDEFLLHPARGESDPGGVWLRGVLKELATALGPLF
ncbi:MAG TPA: LysR family transcriptional regulator [Gemmatimonadaceae bacterium]|nr:LysR family transcriptional regulator [Gemmatimonadaceae bacterium]